MAARPARPGAESEFDAAPQLPPLPTSADLTPDVIADLKGRLQQAGVEPRLFKLTLEGRLIVYRPLFRGDWMEVNAFVQANNNNLRQEDIDRTICERAICWPQEILHPAYWDFQPAGLQSLLAKMVLSRSGFFDADLDQTAYLKVEPLCTIDREPKPAESVIQELKQRYPQWALKLVLVEGCYYVVRPVNRAEWKQLSSVPDVDLDLATAERAAIWSREYPGPANFADRIAGTVRTLSEVVMRISGFVNEAVVEEL